MAMRFHENSKRDRGVMMLNKVYLRLCFKLSGAKVTAANFTTCFPFRNSLEEFEIVL